MNKHKSLKSTQSLLERASDLYGFDNNMRNKSAVDKKISPVVSVGAPKKAKLDQVSPGKAISEPIPEVSVTHPISKAAVRVEAEEKFSDTEIPLEAAREIVAEPEKAPVISAAPKPVIAPSPAIDSETANQSSNLNSSVQGSDVMRASDDLYNNEAVRKISRNWLNEHNLLIPNGPVTALSEEFRIVKRQLLLAARGGKGVDAVEHGERILICSANPNEGKTYTSVNLALSMASEKDNRVLLVDADFAKPSILSTLNIEGGPGLMDALADPSLDVSKMVLDTDVEGLSVLPAGSQSNQDTEYLAAARTAKIIDKLSQDDPNRIIIFDSPPALAASPASVLALHVGQTLMVVHADKTTDSALRDALNLLSGCDHVQLLLNRANFSPSGRKFGSYYGYGA